MNRPIENSDYKDLEQQVEELRKRLGEMESKLASFRRRRALPILLFVGVILLTFGVLGAEGGPLQALFVSASGNVGIRESNPQFPLSFAPALGDKVSLFPYTATDKTGKVTNYHYGFGIQNSLLQIYTPQAAEDIAFGYGTSASLNESMRIKGNGNLGIGTKSPLFPLSFAEAVGDKISLFPYTVTDNAGKVTNLLYGLGIQHNLLQIHTPTEGSDIAFGYGTSASFRQTMRIKGNGSVLIGSKDPKTQKVTSEIRGKPWFSQEYEWKKDQAAVTMTRVDRSVCFLTMIAGGFNGISEFAQITEYGDHWMLGGKASNSAVRVKARCIGAPDDAWTTP
jgi:hypothetical protein